MAVRDKERFLAFGAPQIERAEIDEVVATLEPKPGVPVSGAHLARLLEQLTPNPPAAIIRAPFENEKPAEWLSSRLDVPIILMPYTVGGNDDSADLISLYDATITLLEARR